MVEYPPAEGAENGLEFTIVRPFNWIGPRMDFIPGVDGPSEGVPRVLACFSNVCVLFFSLFWLRILTLVLHLVQSSQEMYGIDGFAESAPPRALEAC